MHGLYSVQIFARIIARLAWPRRISAQPLIFNNDRLPIACIVPHAFGRSIEVRYGHLDSEVPEILKVETDSMGLEEGLSLLQIVVGACGCSDLGVTVQRGLNPSSSGP